MNKTLASWLAGVALVATLGGCAHPINLSPDLTQVMGSGASKIDRKVGLVINDDMRKKEVTSAGGGGDQVRYQPYRDVSPGLYLALSESFTGVSSITGTGDPKAQADGVQLFVTPTLSTTSYSPSLVTWPPTVFTVEVTLSFTDAKQAPVAEVRAQGEGRAEFNEFVKDFSLSAKRATEDALKKLVKAIGEAAPKLR